MQTLLNDIDLDIQELKFLIKAISSDDNPALRVVAKRNIHQMQERLNILLKHLDEPCESASVDEKPAEIVAPVCKKEPVLETPRDAQIIIESTPAVPNSTSPILAERIKSAIDLRHAISLNDSFRFTRELFGGDAARMNQVVHEIGEASTLDKALEIYMSTVRPDEENEASADFIELLKKYYN